MSRSVTTRLIDQGLALVIAALTFSFVDNCYAQATSFYDGYAWTSDKEANRDIANSRGEESLNFKIVGNLSYYSFYLVERSVSLLANEAGLTVDRSAPNFSILVVHDENAFTRLRNDKKSFEELGLPPFVIEAIDKQASQDAKCFTSTFSDSSADITLTVILLSDKYNGCLVRGLFDAFGVRIRDGEEDFVLKYLMKVCLLYEGRRRGLRTREQLRGQQSALATGCIERSGTQKGK